MVKWAQREDKVFITVEITDSVDPKIELTAEKLVIAAKGGPDKKDYAVSLEFYEEVDPAESKQAINANKLFFTVARKEAGEYWPRLQKLKTKEHWLKIDFAKWKDEDDSGDDEKPDDYGQGMEGMGGPPGMGGGPPGMGGMGGGPPGMGGMPPGMDMEALMKQMQGGAGGGGPDMAAMMQQMGGMGGGPPGGMPGLDGPPPADEDDEPDSDDDDMPELE